MYVYEVEVFANKNIWGAFSRGSVCAVFDAIPSKKAVLAYINFVREITEKEEGWSNAYEVKREGFFKNLAGIVHEVDLPSSMDEEVSSISFCTDDGGRLELTKKKVYSATNYLQDFS